MALPSGPRRVRVIAGEIDTRQLTTRLLVPSAQAPNWSPFVRVAESIASRGRQLPAHSHDHEEVFTLVTDGFAAYQLADGPVELLPPGAARLLVSPSKTPHRVSPAQGGAIRWFNIVLSMPDGGDGKLDLQSAGPGGPGFELDLVHVRPLVGPSAPMHSRSGLECQVLTFTEDSATIPKVGRDRRGLFYVLSGAGTIDDQPVEAGEAALIEAAPGVTIRGDLGFRAVLATAPRPS